MSLWQKIKRLVSGNAHDALDSMEDVGTASRQIVREMDEKLQSAVYPQQLSNQPIVTKKVEPIIAFDFIKDCYEWECD